MLVLMDLMEFMTFLRYDPKDGINLPESVSKSFFSHNTMLSLGSRINDSSSITFSE